MTTIPIQLPDDVRLFAESYAKNKGFATVNDFISSLVTDLKDRQTKLEADLSEGLDSGPATVKTPEDWRQMRSRVASQEIA
jgi:hypothetical protein